MKNGNGNIFKIISLIFTGAVLIGSGVAQSFKIASDARDYTDKSVKELRVEQQESAKDIQQVKQDVAVIRIILEERFGKKR